MPSSGRQQLTKNWPASSLQALLLYNRWYHIIMRVCLTHREAYRSKIAWDKYRDHFTTKTKQNHERVKECVAKSVNQRFVLFFSIAVSSAMFLGNMALRYCSPVPHHRHDINPLSHCLWQTCWCKKREEKNIYYKSKKKKSVFFKKCSYTPKKIFVATQIQTTILTIGKTNTTESDWTGSAACPTGVSW